MKELSANATHDVLALFANELLGSGIARRVYALNTDATRVLKVEHVAGSFQNVTEWETWRALDGTEYQKFLAPCFHISPSGVALIQARVTPLKGTERQLRNLRLPSFLTDFKLENYGLYKGRVVCCDYGCNLATNHGAFASRMRKPKWYTVQSGVVVIE